MVCCQPSGKNDPEQIAASFHRQGGTEGEGGGRRASERTDFPHSAYDIRRPPSLALPPLPMTALGLLLVLPTAPATKTLSHVLWDR